jgi:hypothetical protein
MDDCSGSTPQCDTASMQCVECLTSEDCTGMTPGCDTTTNTCVACLDDSHCTDPMAAKCDTATHSCVACDSSSQCAGLSGTEVCATDGAKAGQCVQCTASERDACALSMGGGMTERNVCDATQRTCTDQEPGSATQCQPCVADAQCREGQLCMATTFNATPVGTFCLWKKGYSGTGGPGPTCRNVRPFGHEITGTSVDGVSATVCGPAPDVTTCTAIRDYLTLTECSGDNPTGASECGAPGTDDSVCKQEWRVPTCHHRCADLLDCPKPIMGAGQTFYYRCRSDFYCEQYSI